MASAERKGLLEELKRRKVYRVAATYAAIAFFAIQIADLIIPAFDTTGVAYRLVVILALLGFPVAVVLAWVFELTPGGLRVTRPGPDTSSDNSRPGLAALTEFLIVVLVLAAAALGTWYLGGRHTPTSDAKHSIAVLPFTEVGQSDGLSFASGFHDDLLTRLSNIHGFTVIASSSVEPYRNARKPLSEIAQDLTVRWIVTGDIQRVEDQVRVNARLIDPASGIQEWGDSYHNTLSPADLFSVQSKITHQIADALETRLTPTEERSVSVTPTDNLDAYRLFIEARTLLELREEPQMRRALTLFQQAAEIDPEFVLAWVGVADSVYELIDYGFSMPEGSIEIARHAAEQALELDPENPEAHVSMGMIHHLSQDGIEVLSHLNRAIELRPSYAEAFSKISWVGQLHGRLILASQAADQAITLNPLAIEPIANFAMTRIMSGDYQSALDALESQRGLMQEWPTFSFYKGVALYHLGRYDEALESLHELSIPWAGQGPLALTAMSLAAQGDSRGALSIIERLRAQEAHPFLIALISASLGENEAAFLEIDSIDDWSIDSDWPILAARSLFPRATKTLRADARYDRMLRDIDRAWGLVN